MKVKQQRDRDRQVTASKTQELSVNRVTSTASTLLSFDTVNVNGIYKSACLLLQSNILHKFIKFKVFSNMTLKEKIKEKQ